MGKIKWEKLAIIAPFVSSIIVAIFAAITTWYGTKLSNQVEHLKTDMEENKMISSLVSNLSNDPISCVKFDFALLALERYLRNSSSNGELTPQDKEMLIGFAQTLILDRKKTDSVLYEKMLIPIDFLQRYDTMRLMEIKKILANQRLQKRLAVSSEILNNMTLLSNPPIRNTRELSTNDNELSKVLNKVAYIQYSNLDKQDEALNIQKKLSENHWVVPDVDFVKGTYTHTIRYFHQNDKSLADELKKLLGKRYRIIYVKSSVYEEIVPNGQVEVWISFE
ncbi:MAG: hypothetical protein Q8909_13080 [Bacteroidota bacterium]|nr:hypothetical protein [Bacteroidota bacterium]